LPPPQSSGKCGGFGQVLMIVVAIAATVYTAGAAATYLMPELVATAAAAGQGAGASVLSGAFMSASPGLSLAASAAGGAAGSVAGQAVGIATGRQQDFSWRQVAMSAVGSMVSSSIGPGAIGANPLSMSPYQAAAARAAFTSTSLQAVSMASGQQGRFNWRAVAASAVGAGLGQGAQVGFGAQAAPSALSTALGETFGEVGRGTVFGMMSGAAASAIGSGRVMARQVAVDAFGNALGNGLAAGRGAPTPAGSGLRTSQEQVEAWGPQYGQYETSRSTDYSLTAGGPLPRLSTTGVDPMPADARAESNAKFNALVTLMSEGGGPSPARAEGSGGDASVLYADASGAGGLARTDMLIPQASRFLPGRGAGARLEQMYDVNVRRDLTRSVLAQPNGDEAGDRAIRELRLRQQALLAPPIDPTIDLPLMVAGPAVQAARWLGRTALGSAETVSARLLAPKELGSVGNVALGVDRAQVLANIADSQGARASSNFGQFVKNEGQVQANLGIWPPNSGGYAPTYGTMLDVGTQLDRFGYPGGTFVSPLGASFESRALPPSYLDTKPYFQYEVVQPIPGVTEAKALPWFGQPGMGMQFQLPKPVQYYLENGSLKVIKQ
jgi:hypothetical protein